ncbi:MAG: hypothetical protein VKJ64_17700, partial [Leptolyngbyaceae bacterium]|nr:hypothetical protein [Leptolyngbyaceae bacterium]
MNSLQLLGQRPRLNQQLPLSWVDQSMVSRHTCLCCSNILLRHVFAGKLYWRCSHCHQAMPLGNPDGATCYAQAKPMSPVDLSENWGGVPAQR